MKNKMKWYSVLIFATILQIGCGIKHHEAGFGGGAADFSQSPKIDLEVNGQYPVNSNINKFGSIENYDVAYCDTMKISNSKLALSSVALISKLKQHNMEIPNWILKKYQSKVNSVVKSRKNENKNESVSFLRVLSYVFCGISVFVIIVGFVLVRGKGFGGLVDFLIYLLISLIFALLGLLFFWLS